MRMMGKNDSGTEPAPADQDWFGGRRWTGIAAIGVLIVVVVCVLVIFIAGLGGNSSTTGTPATGPAAPTAAPGAAPLPTTVPTSAPQGVSWSIYETVALPSLSGVGPAHVDGAIATGYAHTPLGALLADANEGSRYLLAPDTQWRAAADAMLAKTPGYDAWLAIRASHPYGPDSSSGNDQLTQIAGFQFVSYTPSDAVIQIVTRTKNGNYQVGADHVTWDGTDWKYVNAADGGQVSNIQTIPNLAGFIEWRGV